MIDLARCHAAFIAQQIRGDVSGWPFDPASIDPPATAPLFATALVQLAAEATGEDPPNYSGDALCALAQRGQAMLESGAASIEDGERAVDEVIAALEQQRLRGRASSGVRC